MTTPTDQVKNWIRSVVIGLNFCPFAAPVVKQNGIVYLEEPGLEAEACLQALAALCARMDADPAIETAILIITAGFEDFEDYLDLLDLAERFLHQRKYEGIYQLASFHPQYRFAGEPEDDPANYTNRSPFPLLHLLREESIEVALENFPDPDAIPERNIRVAREKGIAFLQQLLNNARTDPPGAKD